MKRMSTIFIDIKTVFEVLAKTIRQLKKNSGDKIGKRSVKEFLFVNNTHTHLKTPPENVQSK